MPSDEKDPLQSLIAEILEAENRGESVDRDALLSQYPEHADSLRDFFVDHDRMKAAADQEDPTLPPSGNVMDEATIPPHQSANDAATISPEGTGEDRTVPPTEPASPAGASVGDSVRYFGDYELLEEIARGGMGVVFKARQINLNRIVALKMILSGEFAGEEDVKRFHTEAEAAAQLDHPGIVPIFEIGEHQGQHYFSMGYIEGESLAQKVADGPLPPREAAEQVKKVCDAMAYAHERGVIHRDLKPANILIDRNGQPKVTDFGLAKKADADSNLTGTGQILGTPAYMPPEQASGKADVGPLADVYSLGAILYCLLTGRPPFQAASPMDTLLQVLDREPVSPQAINSQISQDLDTICLKCLCKEAKKRYRSTHELGDELQRYLNGESILARPVGPLQRTWRWCKRNPALSFATTIAAFLLMSVAIAAPIVAYTQSQLRGQADKKAEEAQREKDEANRQKEKANRQLYLNRIALAQREWEADNPNVAWDELTECPVELRGWEHDYLSTLLTKSIHAETLKVGEVTRVSFYEDERVVCGLSDGTLKLLEVKTGKEIHTTKGHTSAVASIAVHKDSERFASGAMDGSVKLWDLQGYQEVLTIKGHDSIVRGLAFNPDGSRIAVGYADGKVKVWNAHDGEEVLTLEGHVLPVVDVGFSLDGTRIISCAFDLSIKTWDANSGEETAQLTINSVAASCVAFNLDCSRIVSGASDGSVHLWDAKSGHEILALKHEGYIFCVDFCADGTRVVAGSSDKTLKVWETQSGKEVISCKGHEGIVTNVAFSPDGGSIASGSASDKTIRFWDSSKGGPTLEGHTGSVTCVTFSPTDAQVVSGSSDKTLRIWDIASNATIFTLTGHTGQVSSVAFSPDGDRIISGSHDRTIRVWDARRGEEIRTLGRHSGPVSSVMFSPDGTRIISVSTDNAFDTVKVWDAESGKPILTTKGDAGSTNQGGLIPFCGASFSPDGTRIASFSGDETLKVWERNTGREIVTCEGHKSPIRCAAFSPDGKRIASGSAGLRDNVKLWDAMSGEEILTLKGHANYAECLAFSPDGSRLVSGSYDRTIKVWDAHTGEETLTLRGHLGPISSVAFSQDGSRIASGSLDPSGLMFGRTRDLAKSTVRVWDATRRMRRGSLAEEELDELRLLDSRNARSPN